MAQDLPAGAVLADTITTNNINQLVTGQTYQGDNSYYVGDPLPIGTAIDPGKFVIQPSPPNQPYHGEFALRTPGIAPIKVEDEHLEDLIEMLELDESLDGVGICLEIKGKRYSLVDILHAQMKFMFRMNVLLVHRQLGRANAED